MILYDIHTHKKYAEGNFSGCEIRTLFNTSPELLLSCNEEFPAHVYLSCGIHPWEAGANVEQLSELERILSEGKVIAVGEVGLDKLKGASLDVQIEVFRQQVELAVLFHKPLIIHCVKAWDELIKLFKEFKTDVPWILHGYRGGAEQTKQLVRLGFKFSIGEKFNAEALSHIPSDSIFCETDESETPIRKVYEKVSCGLGIEFEHFVYNVAENVKVNLKNMTK